MIDLVCPKCKIPLNHSNNKASCILCGFVLFKDGNLYKEENKSKTDDQQFYDDIYNDKKGNQWIQGLKKGSLVKSMLEKISLSYRRERFFKKNLHGTDNKILDLACGAGRDYFKNYGEVIGIDLSLKPLEIAKNRYDGAILGDVSELPFSDNAFDYVISSDFFGHIKDENKNKIIKEIFRVLKNNGKTLHIIETDSSNYWFKVAHKYPDLFQEYFIDQIGGHIGLEMPSEVISRWQDSNFNVIRAIKIWGIIWPIQDYKILFDNEYRKKSLLINNIALASKILSKYRILRELTNVIFSPINVVVEKFSNIDNGQGLMIVCQKKIS